MARLVGELRARRFDMAVLLTRSRNLTLAMAAAGVPVRYGFGVGAPQRLLLRRPYLPASALGLHPYEQAGVWLRQAGITLEQAEPRLRLEPAAMAQAAALLGAGDPRFVVLGIASSDEWKKWGAANFAALATRLLALGWTRLFLCGGLAEQADAARIVALLDRASAARVAPVLGWDLRAVAALLVRAAFYVGHDTALLNIAAAVGTRSYGLFGATPVLRHSRQIVPVVPPGGPDRASGMARISIASVLEAVAAERA